MLLITINYSCGKKVVFMGLISVASSASAWEAMNIKNLRKLKVINKLVTMNIQDK